VGRPKERTPELRDRVLEAAMAMLEAEGVGAFTARRVAATAQSSTAAVYELFGDKAGLVREIFFSGFRLLSGRLSGLAESPDPRSDLIAVVGELRAFGRDHPALAEVMFSRPFADFDPGPDEAEAGRAVREFIVRRVRRGIEAGKLVGHETDIAHVLLAMVQGLARQEQAGWLGTSRASVNRRWALATGAVLDGLGPHGDPAVRPTRSTRRPARGSTPTASPRRAAQEAALRKSMRPPM
jgi:AcrR family transcriptional regulator